MSDHTNGNNNRISVLLSVHALFSMGLGILSAFMASGISAIVILLPIWGLSFFTVFYFVGQKVRPFPVADLVTGLRLIVAVAFYVLIHLGRTTTITALMVVLVLEAADGIDGWLARRTGPTEFGGMWDMESDAFVILLLSVAAVASGSQPYWALWPGLIRYLFFFVFLWLKPRTATFPRSLSWFSKTVCVAAVFCLGSTWYLAGASTFAIATVSILLTVSFAWESLYYVHLRFHNRKR